MFSSRTPSDLNVNRLTLALDARKAEGRPFVDLTESNPTRAGFDYPEDLLAPLGHARGLTYAPSPFGLLDARRVVAREYASRGRDVPPDRIVLTASTSEAYSVLFKLLADAGDAVLVPRPSYPLFDHLTQLELVTAQPYDLEYHGRWCVDFASLERAVSPRTRAVLVVSPNNPTGSYVTAGECQRLADFCVRHDLALIADEVFAEYELAPGALAAAGSLASQAGVLGFSLGGLSKAVGLPQVKLAWTAVSGPDRLVAPALERLEMICDSYLSVSTPVQAAAADLLARGASVRDQIAGRVSSNYRRLLARVADVPSCQALASEGGWYGVLQVPTLESEETLALDLLQQDGVLVHPGYFFDFPRESFLVLSLLTREDRFADGVDRILRRFTPSTGAHD